MKPEPTTLLTRPVGFGQVVLVTGHMTDGPTRSASRFPEHAVPSVTSRIERTFASWRLGEGDLLISGGARGGDLIAACTADAMGATVWLLLAEPPDAYENNSVAGSAEHWLDDFRSLVARSPTWVLDDSVDDQDPDAIYVAANEWMLSVALTQANGHPLRVLAVWDGHDAPGPGGSAHMVDAARRAGADITIIDPRG